MASSTTTRKPANAGPEPPDGNYARQALENRPTVDDPTRADRNASSSTTPTRPPSTPTRSPRSSAAPRSSSAAAGCQEAISMNRRTCPSARPWRVRGRQLQRPARRRRACRAAGRPQRDGLGGHRLRRCREARRPERHRTPDRRTSRRGRPASQSDRRVGLRRTPERARRRHRRRPRPLAAAPQLHPLDRGRPRRRARAHRPASRRRRDPRSLHPGNAPATRRVGGWTGLVRGIDRLLFA